MPIIVVQGTQPSKGIAVAVVQGMQRHFKGCGNFNSPKEAIIVSKGVAVVAIQGTRRKLQRIILQTLREGDHCYKGNGDNIERYE